MSQFKYYLDSRHSITGGENPADCVFRLPSIVTSENYTFSVALESCIIPNTAYNIGEHNNRFAFSRSSNPALIIQLSIPPSQYTAQALGQAVVDAINTHLGTTYMTMNFLASLQWLVFSRVPGQSDFRWEATPDNLYFEAGDLPVGGSYSTQKLSRGPVNLSGSMYMDLVCSFGSSAISSGGVSNIFARVPMKGVYGSLEYWESTDLVFTRTSIPDLQSVEIRLFNDQGRPVILPRSAHSSFTFVVKSMADL